MAVDLIRIIQAVEAALENQASPGSSQPQDGNQRKRKGLTAPRALLVGAGVATAGRLLVRARGGNLLDNLQQRLEAFESEYLGVGEDDEPEDEEHEEEPEGEYDEEEEPEDEEHEEEPEGEYDEEEEPEDEYDEEEEPEGEYDGDEEPEGESDEEEEPEGEDKGEPEPPRRGSRRATAGGGRGRR